MLQLAADVGISTGTNFIVFANVGEMSKIVDLSAYGMDWSLDPIAMMGVSVPGDNMTCIQNMRIEGVAPFTLVGPKKSYVLGTLLGRGTYNEYIPLAYVCSSYKRIIFCWTFGIQKRTLNLLRMGRDLLARCQHLGTLCKHRIHFVLHNVQLNHLERPIVRM